MNRFSREKKAREYKAVNEKPRIFSYSSSRRPSSASAGGSSSTQKKISRLVNIAIAFVLLLGAAYMCLLKPSAQVKISGEKFYPRDKSSYETGIDEQLKGSIFYRNKLTFDSSKLRDDIKQEFPEVNEVDINISPLRHMPIIEITLAKPTARLVTTDKTYILDDEGRALFEQKDASDSLDTDSLLTISDDSGQDITLGKPALTQAQIGFIREVIGQTGSKKLHPVSLSLSSGGTALDVRFKEFDYFVKFSFMADPRQSSGAFIALYRQLQRDGAQPSQYVDLRIPEKAFIK